MNYSQATAQQNNIYSNAQSDAEVPCSELDNIKNRLNEALNFCSMQGDRVEDIDNKLNGSGLLGQSLNQPATVRPVPSGSIGQMSQILDDIMARLQRTDTVVTRLRSAI